MSESDLPEGWVATKVGEVSTVVRGASPRPKGDPRYFGGDIPWISIADVTAAPGKYLYATREGVTPAGAEKSRLLDAGELILSNSGTVCVPKILGVAGCIHDGFIALRELPEGVDKFFLYCFFDRIRDSIRQKHKQGVTQVNLNTGIVRDIDLPLPPANEQRRIVEKIDALFAHSKKAKESLDRIPALLEKLKKSILAAAFRGDLTKDWREAHPDVEPADKLLERIRAERRRRWEEAELAKMRAKGKEPTNDKWKAKYEEPAPIDASLPSLPASWAWASVQSLAVRVSDGVHKKPNYVESGIPFVTVKNLTAGPGIDLSELNYVTEADHEEFIKRTHPERGDILVSKDGTLGVVRVIETDAVFSIFVSVALIKLLDRSMSHYVGRALACPQVQTQMVGVGSGLQHIHLTDLRADCVPVAPREEQDEIVRRLDAMLSRIDHLEASWDGLRSRAEALDQAVLAKAFRGELVPQDPNDEPASVLLERIRAEREVTGTGNGTPARRIRNSRTKEKPSELKAASGERARPSTRTLEAAQPAPRTGGDFLEMSRDEQASAIADALLGHGSLQKGEAIRIAADGLRERKLADFKRLRSGGTLYTAFDKAIEAGVKLGLLDRPGRGQVRAIEGPARGRGAR